MAVRDWTRVLEGLRETTCASAGGIGVRGFRNVMYCWFEEANLKRSVCLGASMDLGTIPTKNVVLASAILTAYIASQSRINGLETSRERERFLNFRLQETTQYSDMWEITIDYIRVFRRQRFRTYGFLRSLNLVGAPIHGLIDCIAVNVFR